MNKITPGFYKVRGFYFLVTYDLKGNIHSETHVDVIRLSDNELKNLTDLNPLTPEQIELYIEESQAENSFLKRGLEKLAQSKEPNIPHPEAVFQQFKDENIDRQNH